MRKLIIGVVTIIGMTGAAFLTTGTANAGSRGGAAISLNFGNVAFAYDDGYWDNGHRWHRWSNAQEQRRYQQRHPSRYNNHRHDRDKDHGWHRR